MSKVDPKSESKEYKVSRNKPFTIPDRLGERFVVALEGVSLVPDDGREFCYVVLPKKFFVPSFDESLKDHIDIVSWASRKPADDARIKIVGEINRKTGVIKVKGSGFEFVNIRIVWIPFTETDSSKE